MLGGPLLGVMSIGIFVPQANSLVRENCWGFLPKLCYYLTVFIIKGAFIGLVTSTILNLWIGIGTTLNGVSTAVLKPRYVDGCELRNYNSTYYFNATSIFTTQSEIPTTVTSRPQVAINNFGWLHGFKTFYNSRIFLIFFINFKD